MPVETTPSRVARDSNGPAAKARGLLAALAMLAAPGAAEAGPQPCGAITAPRQRAAIAAAELWRAAHWIEINAVWMATYRLKPAPALPLGIGTFVRGNALGAAPAATPPIEGIVAASQLICSSYEIGPEPVSIVVRYVARGLRFTENGKGWTKPLPALLVHALEVSETTSGAAPEWAVRDLPEARTALPPDARLSLPAADTVPPGWR